MGIRDVYPLIITDHATIKDNAMDLTAFDLSTMSSTNPSLSKIRLGCWTSFV